MPQRSHHLNYLFIYPYPSYRNPKMEGETTTKRRRVTVETENEIEFDTEPESSLNSYEFSDDAFGHDWDDQFRGLFR